MLKANTQNIMAWWFAADTPIRDYKLASNPALKRACEQVSKTFAAPSGADSLINYELKDKFAFARAVIKQLTLSTEK